MKNSPKNIGRMRVYHSHARLRVFSGHYKPHQIRLPRDISAFRNINNINWAAERSSCYLGLRVKHTSDSSSDNDAIHQACIFSVALYSTVYNKIIMCKLVNNLYDLFSFTYFYKRIMLLL